MSIPDALSIEDLVVAYGRFRAVDGLSLAVRAGEVHGLLGPNGAGKTSTLRAVLGFLTPSRGRVRVTGIDAIAEPVAARAAIGYLPGDVRFDPRPTGAQVLEFLGSLHPGVDRAHRARLVERLDLDPTKRIKAYSRGNRQKLAIVAALQHRPALALLDEPTSGLDPLVQREFRAILAELAAGGTAVLFSTHVLSEVAGVCDTVAVMRQGRLVFDRPVDALARETVRRLEVVFAGEPPSDEALGLPGLIRTERRGDSLSIHLDGDPDAVVKALARHAIRDVVFERPDIEDLFLKYYPDRAEP